MREIPNYIMLRFHQLILKYGQNYTSILKYYLNITIKNSQLHSHMDNNNFLNEFSYKFINQTFILDNSSKINYNET